MKRARKRASGAAGWFDELVIDNFAGGGGASLGIERALGRAVDAAINHDASAVEMHRANHPHTRHYCENVWSVDPFDVAGGRPVGLCWFSPDCKHFSRAKGGKPVEKKIRGLAWVVVRWAAKIRPRVIMLENVREFETWGPLDETGRPCPRRKGVTFRRWVGTLRSLGYVVEWRELNAADYGAPTFRRRLFLIARRDGLPIVWPSPTHGPNLKPYRATASCIDWSFPCHSLFLTPVEAKLVGVRRPLAEKTMRRIAMGLKRFVLDNPKPFIVRCNHGGAHFRGRSVGHDIDAPAPTLLGQNHVGEVRVFLTKYYGTGGVGQGCAEPLHAITSHDRFGLVTVAGQECLIADIGLRMLKPRELYRCQGFPDSYRIDIKVNGRPLSGEAQVRMVGNSVCPDVAEAVVKANFGPEIENAHEYHTGTVLVS